VTKPLPVLSPGHQKEYYAFTVATKTVPLCDKAFCMITAIPERTLYHWKARIKQGEEMAKVGKKLGCVAPKTEAARAFLARYASMHDYSPNESSKKNNMTVVSHSPTRSLNAFQYLCPKLTHLSPPPCQIRLDISSKIDVYYLYATFMIRAGFAFPNEVLTYQSFCKVWRDEFPQLKLRKKRTVSSKCLVCDDLEVSM
jgi:hypothetical protein